MDRALVKSVGFVHLHVHSAYSLREGALSIETLAKLAKADEMPALAITDANNLFGALEFSEKLSKAGVQPIIGAQITLDFGDAPTSGGRADPRAARAPVVLLAKDEPGYRNLMRLASRAWLDPTDGDDPHVRFDALGESDGLIALTGGPAGPIDRALAEGLFDLARARLARLAARFDRRLYIELQRHDLETEKAVEPHLIDLAYAQSLPLVATNEPYFADGGDPRRMTSCCASPTAPGRRGTGDARRPSMASRPAPQMRALFADLPEAIDKPWRWPALRDPRRRPASRSCRLRLRRRGLARRRSFAPMRCRARSANRRSRLRSGPHRGLLRAARVRARRHHRDGFPGYFLIVADFIKWAKQNDIPVGPGRGSGAGSVVAWTLTITDLDPIGWACCSSASSIPSACRCPTSTSTSARTGAAR